MPANFEEEPEEDVPPAAAAGARSTDTDSIDPDDQVEALREVIHREWPKIHERRTELHGESRDGDRPPGITGLALSGGGIRSATFCLGVLQEFERRDFLRVFDYLSTVSGGGFVGGFWSAWLNRGARRTLFPSAESIVPSRLSTGPARWSEVSDEETAAGGDPVHHLRLFSNYLTPRKGLFSADTWRAIAVVSRNLALTWAVLIPLLFLFVLGADLYFLALDKTWMCGSTDAQGLAHRFLMILVPAGAVVGWLAVMTAAWVRFGPERPPREYWTPLASLSAVVVLIVALFERSSLTLDQNAPPGQTALTLWLWLVSWGKWLMTPTVGVGVLVWFVVAVALFLYASRGTAIGEWQGELKRNQVTRVQATLLVVLVVGTSLLSLGAFGHVLVGWLATGSPRTAIEAYVQKVGWLSVIASLASAVFTALKAAPTTTGDGKSTVPNVASRVIVMLTPPLVLLALGLGLSFGVHAILFRLQARSDESLRLLQVGSGIAYLLCAVFAWDDAGQFTKRAVVSAKSVRIGASWLLLATAQLFTLTRYSHLATSTLWRSVFIGTGALLLLCSVLAFVAIARLGHRLDAPSPRSLWLLGSAYAGLSLMLLLGVSEKGEPIRLALALAGTTLAWVLALGWTTDPNIVSLHGFYKARLVRAYLGASNQGRSDQRALITAAVDGDDILLKTISNTSRGAPYPLINTTLNLVGGRDLATAQRSSDRFLLSPLYCGSTRTGYRQTENYMGGQLSLGTAVAVSGAAVSPNMGAASPTAALAMILALFNVRLGYWAPTPNKPDWRSAAASLWPVYLLHELLSQTNALSSFCYLTDGGHFDNTGLYSLVERGCRNIVLVDCGADPATSFDDLGTALRRCRIDFGTECDLNPQAIRDANVAGPVHFLVGHLQYSIEHAKAVGIPPNERRATLAVIKPHVGGDEPLDVQQYHWKETGFPQQSTIDQWFDEAQFESYRRLGVASAAQLLDPVWTSHAAAPGAVSAVFDALV